MSISLTKSDIQRAIKTCQHEFNVYGVSTRLLMDSKSKELVILTLAISQKYTNSTSCILKHLLDIYTGSVQNWDINHQEVTEENFAIILKRTNSSRKLPERPKRVHFNSVDGSDVSPPNDRQPGSWIEIWQKVSEIRNLIQRLQKVVTANCQQQSNPEMFTTLCVVIYAMVQLSLWPSANELIVMLHDVIDTELTVGQLCSTMSALLPEILHAMFPLRDYILNAIDSVDHTSQEVVTALYRHMQQHTPNLIEGSIMRTKASWMLGAVVRFHLRWLLDNPPHNLSKLSTMSIICAIPSETRSTLEVNSETVCDEISFYSHCRSAMWSCVELQYEQPPLFTFRKDKCLKSCVHSIDCSFSPPSSSNLSYLFTEGLRQIFLAVNATQSFDSAPGSSKSEILVDILLGGEMSLEGFVRDLLCSAHSSDNYNIDLFQVILGAEFARQFLATLCALLPRIFGSEASESHSVWTHMSDAVQMMREMGIMEDPHLQLLATGYDGLATVLRRPFISPHTLNQCLLVVQTYYEARLDELLQQRSFSQPQGKATRRREMKGSVELPVVISDWEEMLSSRPILKFPSISLKRELQQKDAPYFVTVIPFDDSPVVKDKDIGDRHASEGDCKATEGTVFNGSNATGELTNQVDAQLPDHGVVSPKLDGREKSQRVTSLSAQVRIRCTTGRKKFLETSQNGGSSSAEAKMDTARAELAKSPAGALIVTVGTQIRGSVAVKVEDDFFHIADLSMSEHQSPFPSDFRAERANSRDAALERDNRDDSSEFVSKVEAKVDAHLMSPQKSIHWLQVQLSTIQDEHCKLTQEHERTLKTLDKTQETVAKMGVLTTEQKEMIQKLLFDTLEKDRVIAELNQEKRSLLDNKTSESLLLLRQKLNDQDEIIKNQNETITSQNKLIGNLHCQIYALDGMLGPMDESCEQKLPAGQCHIIAADVENGKRDKLDERKMCVVGQRQVVDVAVDVIDEDERYSEVFGAEEMVG